MVVSDTKPVARLLFKLPIGIQQTETLLVSDYRKSETQVKYYFPNKWAKGVISRHHYCT